MEELTLLWGQIRFSELVRIKSILIGTGGGLHSDAPRRVKVWVNRSGIDFEEASSGSVNPDQEWELLQGEGNRGSTDYPVRVTRFSNVSSLDLYFVRRPPSLRCSWLGSSILTIYISSVRLSIERAIPLVLLGIHG